MKKFLSKVVKKAFTFENFYDYNESVMLKVIGRLLEIAEGEEK
jgi:hypothetical protein